MNTNFLLTLALVSIPVSLFGFWLVYLYGRKTKRFRWSEYLALVTVPLLPIAVLSYFEGIKIWVLFLVYAVVGTFAEYFLGWIYNKILNKKLWVYKKYSISGYTSFLSLPLWGVGGFIFWFLAKAIGL
ncbi:MAG: hypothetical protein AB1721_01745 [Patescibacteria group bacterium]